MVLLIHMAKRILRIKISLPNIKFRIYPYYFMYIFNYNTFIDPALLTFSTNLKNDYTRNLIQCYPNFSSGSRLTKNAILSS